MLIVTRSAAQAVVVGEFDGFERVLKVTVLAVRGGQVRLGFELLGDETDTDGDAWEQSASERPASRRSGRRTASTRRSLATAQVNSVPHLGGS